MLRAAREMLCAAVVLGVPCGITAAAEDGSALTTARAEEAKGIAALAGEGGAVVRPQYWFGVAVEHIPPVIAKQLKLQPDQGLLVMGVLPNTPAEKAGLKADDLLIELDGAALTSQEDLARAANTNRALKTGGEPMTKPAMKSSKVVFLREGDRKSVTMTPAQRPENMLVMGNNLQRFSPQQPGAEGARRPMDEVTRNIVLPDGTAAQVGPGYTVELNGGEASTLTVKSIRQLMNKGETVVLSQETDGAGNIKNRIVVGSKSYSVEAGKEESLPADLRPLARELLVNQNAAPQVGGVAPQERPAAAGVLEERVRALEERNSKLQDQLQVLIDLLKKDNAGAGK